MFNITRSIFESFSVKTESNFWHVMLTLCFVKVTHGYVKFKKELNMLLPLFSAPLYQINA